MPTITASPPASEHIPERGDYAPIQGLVVILSRIGGAKNAACFAYPLASAVVPPYPSDQKDAVRSISQKAPRMPIT